MQARLRLQLSLTSFERAPLEHDCRIISNCIAYFERRRDDELADRLQEQISKANKRQHFQLRQCSKVTCSYQLRMA